MINLFEKWKPEIHKYFVANNLEFSKVIGCGVAMGEFDGVKTLLLLDATPDENSHLGLLDDTPAPLLLMVEEKDGELVFTETELTRQYFS
ncbi:MAG: hypothetical protein ACOX7J_06635 [Bacillota bacterium]|jgi:hypothetical protein